MTKRFAAMLAVLSFFSPIAVWAGSDALAINIATEAHPHVRALQDGRVPVQGCEIHFSTQARVDLQNDLIRDHRYDVLEVEFLPYLEMQSAGKLKDYALVPVFLDREFQLRYIVIRTDRGIKSPEDLRGKTIGVAGYGRTTPTWLRGILQSSWTVRPEEIKWVDTEDSSAPVHSLAEGLSSGKLDGALMPDVSQSFLDKNPKVVRLYPDYQNTEYAVFEQTRIFPIITVLAVRQKLVDENPWLPEALFIAFSGAKKKAMADLTLPLPWGGAKLDETEKLMGKNFWSYGVKSNPKSLGALFRYADEQKLLQSPRRPEDVFAPSTLMLLED